MRSSIRTSTDFARLPTVSLDWLVSMGGRNSISTRSGQCLHPLLVAFPRAGQFGTCKVFFAWYVTGRIFVGARCCIKNIWYVRFNSGTLFCNKLPKIVFYYTWLTSTGFSVTSACLGRRSWTRFSSIFWGRAVASSSPWSSSSSARFAAFAKCAPLPPHPVNTPN